MKKVLILAITILFLFNLPLGASEELMTKLFFNNWLKSKTTPLEEHINGLKTTYGQMEEQVRSLRSQLVTEIRVTIGSKSALIDENQVALDVAPIISGAGRTMVPVRFIGEAFGAQFSWDEKTRKVTYQFEGTTIELFIDKKTAYLNKKAITLDVAPIIVSGRTLVPLRFVGEHMGATFDWNAQTQTAIIYR